MHKDSTTQAKQKKDEREEVLKEIRQLENRQKILENKQQMCIRDRFLGESREVTILRVDRLHLV